jgi:hypothetical protein
MTFKNLIDDTLDLCQELQGKPDFTVVRVKRMINRAYYDFARQTRCLRTELNIATVANQESYAINDEVYDFHHLRYVTDSTAEYGKILYPYPGGYSKLPRNKGFGEPVYYYIVGIVTRTKSEIGFYPIPDAVEAVKGWCTIFPGGTSAPELTLDAHVPLFKDAWHDALVHYAVWKLFASYSHLNPAINRKSLEFKTFYNSDVQDFQMNNIFGGELNQVYDSYAEY